MKKIEKLEKALNLYNELLELDEKAEHDFSFMDEISEKSKAVEIDNAYSELLKIRTALTVRCGMYYHRIIPETSGSDTGR